MEGCEIGDEGMTSLFANLDKDDFKVLEELSLAEGIPQGIPFFGHPLSVPCATLVSAIKCGKLPALVPEKCRHLPYVVEALRQRHEQRLGALH